jgi:hypothetical protein
MEHWLPLTPIGGDGIDVEGFVGCVTAVEEWVGNSV